MLLLILKVVALALFVYQLLKEAWMRWNYDLHKIPAAPMVPVLGHLVHFLWTNKPLALHVWVRVWREKLDYPKLLQFCGLGQRNLIITDGTLVREKILSKKDETIKGGPFVAEVQRYLMGLDSTRGFYTTVTVTPYVKEIRKCFLMSVTSECLKKNMPKFKEIIYKALDYVDKRRNDGAIDTEQLFCRMTLDLVGKVGLNLNLGGLDKSTALYDLMIICGYYVGTVSERPLLQLYTEVFPMSRHAKKRNKDYAELHAQFAQIGKEIASRPEPSESDHSFWANLKRARMPETNEPLPQNLFNGEVSLSLLAGMDTTGHQLAWIFAFLASHPHVVEKLIDELRSHGLYGEEARDLEYDDLAKLKYLTAVVKEVMRKAPVAGFVTSRTADKDMVLDGYRIPKGTTLLVAGNEAANSEHEWEDHRAFKPERWLDPNLNVSEKYYFPFSHGARDCVGMKFAMQAMKMTIIYFITKYSMELVGEDLDSLVRYSVLGVISRSRNGIWVKFKPEVCGSTG